MSGYYQNFVREMAVALVSTWEVNICSLVCKRDWRYDDVRPSLKCAILKCFIQ